MCLVNHKKIISLIIGTCGECLRAKFTKYDESSTATNSNDRKEGKISFLSLLSHSLHPY